MLVEAVVSCVGAVQSPEAIRSIEHAVSTFLSTSLPIGANKKFPSLRPRYFVVIDIVPWAETLFRPKKLHTLACDITATSFEHAYLLGRTHVPLRIHGLQFVLLCFAAVVVRSLSDYTNNSSCISSSIKVVLVY